MIVTCPGCQSHYRHPSGPQVRARCGRCDARFVISGSGKNYHWRDIPVDMAAALSTPTPIPTPTPAPMSSAAVDVGPVIGMDDPALAAGIAVNGLQSDTGESALHWTVQADPEDTPAQISAETPAEISADALADDSLDAFAAGFGESSAPIDMLDFRDPEVVAHYEEIEPVPEVAGSGIPGPPSHDSAMVTDYPGDEILIDPPTLDRLGLTNSSPGIESFNELPSELSRPATRASVASSSLPAASSLPISSAASVRAPLWVLLAGAGTTAAGYHGAPFLKAWLDRSAAFEIPIFFMQPPIAALLSGCLGLLIGAGVARWMQRS